MGALKHLMDQTKAKAADKAAAAKRAAQTSTPQSLPDVGPVDPNITNRLADLYSQAFGSGADQSMPVVAVPVNPPAQGGGGMRLGSLLLLGGLGIGGWFLYKHMKAKAAA